MPEPEVVYSPSGKHSTMKVVVILQLNLPTVAHAVSSSDYSGKPEAKEYLDPKTKKARTGMCGEEFADVLAKYFSGHDTPLGVRTRSMPARPAVIVLDRDPSHTSWEAKLEALNNPNFTLDYMPPRSPDLSPLDSGFLGTVKRRLHKERLRDCLTWEDSCDRLLQLLRTTDPAPYLLGVHARVQATILAQQPVGALRERCDSQRERVVIAASRACRNDHQ
jgi:hypothetical protein